MDFIETGLTLKKEDFNDYIKERLLTIYHENIFYFPFIWSSCISFHRSSLLEPKTKYQLFNMIIGFECKDARAHTRRSRYARLATHLNLNMLWSNPRNKNVEKRSGQLKFEVTDLETHLHKITCQFYLAKN